MTPAHKPKKHLGQNFLQSERIIKRIIKTAGVTPKDTVIEIGPGLGILTNQLAQITKHITAIELDPDLIPILQEKLPPYVKILNEDALDFTPPNTSRYKHYKIVANIPYYITSPLITHFLTAKNPPTSLTLLVQKEVAERICENPPESILALQAQLYTTPRLAFAVPAKHFNPKPKVDSAVIHLQTLENPIPPKTAQKILALAKQAFSQKRKKLSNTLKSHREQLEKLNLQDRRPQHLTLKDWENLADAIDS